MKAVLFILAIICTAAFARTLTANQYEFLFTRFVEQYDKKYETNNFFARFNIFKSNLDMILAHNAKNLSWTMAVNQFADYTTEEFEAMMGLNNVVEAPFAHSLLTAPVKNIKIAESIDWRAKNVVNPVKNQASCGSCWAFSAVSGIESSIAIKTGQLHDLSEQQLVDCSGSYGNHGCNGGLMSSAYEYVKAAGGVCATSDYAYTARDESCKDSSCKKIATVTGYKFIANGDQAHLEALQDQPIPVAIAASSSAFQFYNSGILTQCSDRSVNHAVNLVGYGVEGGVQYYILRNSWGTSWGDAGYMKIATGNNLCGLTTSRFDCFPTV